MIFNIPHGKFLLSFSQNLRLRGGDEDSSLLAAEISSQDSFLLPTQGKTEKKKKGKKI